MMNTVREKKFRRALMVALFHPLNQSIRKMLLELRSASEESNLHLKFSELATETFVHNPFRQALLDLLLHGSDRFVLLVSLLIESTLRSDISSCNCFLSGVFERTYDDEGNCSENIPSPDEGIEAVAAVLEPLVLLRIWDGSNECTSLESIILETPVKELPGGSTSVVHSNNLANDLDAEASPAPKSVPDKDYKREMNEYAYGCEIVAPVASRCRGGSADMVFGNEVNDTGVIDDAIAVSDLTFLDRFNEPAERPGLIEALHGVLLSAHKHSLTTLQVHYK